MEKYKEDLLSMGQETTSKEDINDSKEAAIKTILGQENIDLDKLSDDELDTLLVQAVEASGMNEQVENMITCMKLAGGDLESIKEAIHIQTGMKLEEAEEILKDKRLNG